ncbi:MAG: phosphotransferase, partial [Mycobacterium sp.]
MTTFDFFSDSELRVPVINVADAALLASTHFGINASVTALGSQQDANFLLFTGDGTEVGVLKVANPAFTRVEIEAQDAAARFVTDREPSVRTSRNIEPAGHDAVAEITTVTSGGSGSTLYARVIEYLPGGTLSGDRYVSPARWAALGTLAGRASRVLADFDHPGVDRVLQWDLRHADRTIELLAPHVADTGQRAQIQQHARTAWQAVSALSAQLPVQVIHGDLTDDNAVCSTDDAQLPDGIIDFGDLTRSWAIGELAIALSAVLRHAGGEPAATVPMVAAFHAQRALSEPEIAALWPLVILRAATLVVSGHQQVAIDHENDYATGALDNEWRIFERSVSVPAEVMTGLIAEALGVGSPTRTVPGGRLIHGAGAGLLDLSTESDALDEGRWLHTDCENRLAAAILGAGVPVVATGYGQPRLSRSVALSSESPATVPTGIDVWVAADTPLSSPWPGVVTGIAEHGLTLAGEHGALQLRGSALTLAVDVGHSVEQGALLGTASTGRLWLQLTDESDRQIPAFVRPEYAPGWLSLTRDPSALVGLDTPPHAEERSAGLLARRGRAFASVQEQYYAQPPRIERGWREYLQDTDGRSYLDMVNNVTSIGHGHPELAAAVARQWR